MRVDVADTPTKQGMPVDELQDLVIHDDSGLGEVLQNVQLRLTVAERTERYLSYDKRVDHDASGFEESHQRLVAEAQAIDPDRRLNEHHS
jgi:hypothetical protein